VSLHSGDAVSDDDVEEAKPAAKKKAAAPKSKKPRREDSDSDGSGDEGKGKGKAKGKAKEAKPRGPPKEKKFVDTGENTGGTMERNAEIASLLRALAETINTEGSGFWKKKVRPAFACPKE